MLISETYINADKNAQFGETQPYEPFTEELGALFRNLSREYGGCTSKIFIDRAGAPPIACGWVFRKRMEYEDARADWSKDRRFYMREVWVTIYEECEHGDPRELTKRHGREQCATGLRYREI